MNEQGLDTPQYTGVKTDILKSVSPGKIKSKTS